MDNTTNHIDELIGKYLSAEANDKEVEQVMMWASENEDNQKHLAHFRIIFEKASIFKTSKNFDEDAAWNKVKSKLKKKDSKTVSFYPLERNQKLKKSDFNWYWRVAAGFIILLGISITVYKLMEPGFKSIEVIAANKPVTDILPDGSNVFLNKQSKLNYTYDKKKKTHVVNLKGEAFFNIKHDKHKNFIIDMEDIHIRDIGTSFNVKAYPQSNSIEVIVKDGEVIFYTISDSVYLYAGDKGVYNKKENKFIKEKPDINELAYHTKFFIFNDQDLGSIIRNLNSVYDKKIVIDTNLKNCRLTVTFNNEDVDEIASVIAETLNLKIRRSGKQIMLEGIGCE